MGLLKLVIVDDEPILLEGLVKTYDWNGMGYEVVGFAQSGEQALKIIREKKPHVVLTDIRMKQISGLMVMEEIKKENPECQFVVLSAYRDFEYAQKACDLGAFAYLLKPIEDEKLQATMTDVGKICEDQIRNEEKYDRWERLLKKDGDGFLQVVVQKYVQNRLPEEKVDEVFHTLQDVMKEGDRFITVYADLDLAYKITNELEYEASRFSMVRMIEEKIAERFTYWKFESEEGHRTFIIKTQENTAVHELKELLEEVKKEENSLVIAAISKPYKGIRGIRRSFEEAQRLFAVTNASGAGVFTIPETVEEKEESPYPAEAEMMVVNSVRKNDAVQLKQAFVHFIYQLPHREELQCQYMHKIMVKTEFMLKDSYGMDESLNQQKELRISEMNTLISQINPHFLYNTLDTIYMLARINGEEKTMKMIQALSKYLRLSLSKGREIVTVEDELENVKSYMEIQQIRNENLFHYEIECGEELKTRWILKLILQPIVENAVKYGFCDIFEGGLIRISVTEQAGQLTFSVYNNGTPMEEQMAEKLNGLSEIPVSKMKDSFEDKKHGYGVINIITRLRLKYGEDVRFFYESDTNGTVCVIQIPDDGKENCEQ